MSIYRDKWEEEAQKEIEYLLNKRDNYGWTQQDVDRYHFLIKELES